MGYITFDDVPDLITIQNIYKPNPENRRIYDMLFKEFIGIYKHNKAMYRRLNN